MGYNPNFRGTTAKGGATSLQSLYQNGEVSTITKGKPVTVNASGQSKLVNVSSEASVSAIVGVAAEDTPSAANGQVLDCGRLENITTSFAVGTPVWIATDGSLTNIRPEAGVNGFVAGMYVVFVGVIVKNQFNGLQKDLKVYMDLIGQL